MLFLETHLAKSVWLRANTSPVVVLWPCSWNCLRYSYVHMVIALIYLFFFHLWPTMRVCKYPEHPESSPRFAGTLMYLTLPMNSVERTAPQGSDGETLTLFSLCSVTSTPSVLRGRIQYNKTLEHKASILGLHQVGNFLTIQKQCWVSRTIRITTGFSYPV